GSRVIFHGHEPVSAMPDVQRRADILFLALAVNSPHPEIVKTAMPGKMGEYLASGRPILVHAPPDSFISWYFRHYECGVVVDENDPRQLATAINSILTDAALRERVCARARERALVDFDHLKERKRFFEVLERGISETPHVLTETLT
ncbi:MAG TPA: glycosyltransferase, partial [Pyrinomonadaceae bacterium]